MSVHWPILRKLAAQPRHTFVVDDSRSYRGIEILVAALHLADRIERATTRPHVGLLLPTSGATPIALLASWILGRTVVPLNYLLKPSELQFVVDDSEIDTIVTVQPMLDFVETPPKTKTILRLEDVRFKGVPTPRIPKRAPDESLACLLYTSGTSGRPKGVMLTHGNISAALRAGAAHATITPRDTFLGVLPQFHCFGLIDLTLLPLTLGCKVVYTARFVPAKILRLADKHRPSVFIAIPAMYAALAAVKEPPEGVFSNIRYCVSGGEPLSDAVASRFRERFGVTINEGFGMTETAAASHWCLPHLYRPHSVGQPLPGVRQRIVDVGTGADLGPGQEGELRLAGPTIMRGYFKRDEDTAAAFDDQRYLRTGDIATADDEGHIRITGRLKEMIIVGGENVFPREIEEVLDKHPAVHASGVVGQRDDLRGEVPVAFIELAEGQPFEERSIISHCREHLPGYKVPRRVVRLDALPRNPTGKIMRRELIPMARDLAEA